MRRGWILLALVALGASAQAATMADQRARLTAAKRAAVLATARADALAKQAAGERDAADRARAQEASLAARVASTAAELDAAQARSALVGQMLAAQRARLGAAQQPIARLLAALQSLARRPTMVAIAQPGSVNDLVHVRAVLGSTLPVVRARTVAVRADVVRIRALQANAVLAATALRAARGKLETDRIALASLEAAHRSRSRALGRGALGESDRALALGEEARDLVDRMTEEGSAAATAADLATLPGPRPRPIADGAAAPRRVNVYRRAVVGRLVTGLDELSATGVRSRGLTFAVAPRASVVAPAGGTIRYAGSFRGYGRVVIIDHGNGWTSLVTGLGETRVAAGQTVAMGALVGRAAAGDDPHVTIELRRRGRPVDMAMLMG